jgi:hypothetical protein
MTESGVGYLQTLGSELTRGWNRFWFKPSDPVVLGLLRVAVGVIAVYLVASYTPDLERYFGQQGLVPVKALTDLEEATRGDLQPVPPQVREAIPREYRFSYFDRLHSAGALKTAHLAGLAVLTLFALGVFTRVTAVASLIVFLSYVHRAPMLTSGTEPLVAMLLFYLCFGPAGRTFSIDARLAAGRRLTSLPGGAAPAALKTPWATVAVRLIQVHLTLVYAMMAVSKLANDSWWNGLGVWWLITKTESRMIDLTVLHQVPLLVNAWTYGVMLWQALLPILIWNRLARPLMLGINALMWLLLAPVLGNLPLAAVMIVASLAFVSPDWLRRFVAGGFRVQGSGTQRVPGDAQAEAPR